jgi:hypothetical protein
MISNYEKLEELIQLREAFRKHRPMQDSEIESITAELKAKLLRAEPLTKFIACLSGFVGCLGFVLFFIDFNIEDKNVNWWSAILLVGGVTLYVGLLDREELNIFDTLAYQRYDFGYNTLSADSLTELHKMANEYPSIAVSVSQWFGGNLERAKVRQRDLRAAIELYRAEREFSSYESIEVKLRELSETTNI